MSTSNGSDGNGHAISPKARPAKTEWVVAAECHDGRTVILRRHFQSKEYAEDYPVVASQYRRVWAEPWTPRPKPIGPSADFPALPWAHEYGRAASYLVDRNGRRLAILTGNSKAQQATADFLLRIVGSVRR